MTTQLTYNDLIPEVNERFPQFRESLGDLHDAINDNVSVYFTFLSIYLKEHWTEAGIHTQLAGLLQQMHNSGDEATRITLHDFLLDICSSCKEHGLDLNVLVQTLPESLRNDLNSINSNWHRATCELPRGCC
jgi:hypothetical protein